MTQTAQFSGFACALRIYVAPLPVSSIRLLPQPHPLGHVYVAPLIRLLPRSLTLPGSAHLCRSLPSGSIPAGLHFTPGTIIWGRVRKIGNGRRNLS